MDSFGIQLVGTIPENENPKGEGFSWSGEKLQGLLKLNLSIHDDGECVHKSGNEHKNVKIYFLSFVSPKVQEFSFSLRL